MRRLLFAWFVLLWMGGTGPAQAAWTYMGHLDGNTVLIDRSTIQLKG